MNSTMYRLCVCMALILASSFGASGIHAQIGGQTSADGPFLIDDVEDLDLVSETLGRNWVSDFDGSEPVQKVSTLPTTLTAGLNQSPNGVFRADLSAKFSTLLGGFGIPMPSVVGASTLTSPGDITSFDRFGFYTAFDAHLNSPSFQIQLECYPGNLDGSFPTVFWDYTTTQGTTFQWVEVPFSAVAGINNNPDNIPLETLLSQTRFIFFQWSDFPVANMASLTVWIDDISLLPGPTPTPTPTPTPQANGVSLDWQAYE